MNKNNPFIYSETNKRYYTYDYFLQKKFGKKCIKIPLDGGFTCPNIDGTKGTGGCTYCSNNFLLDRTLPISEQFSIKRAALSKKWANAYCISYFQAFTNTYAPLTRLKALYEAALSQPEVVGLSIATRADVLPYDVVDYLAELSKRTFLTVELGLQTIHDSTAEKINRCHTFNEFVEGFNKLKNAGINTCVHIINGLPNENKPMMLETIKKIADIHPDGIKIHLLHIIKNTKMAKQYLSGDFNTLSLDEYTDIVVSQLELLPPDIYIGRVTGDGLKNELIAPLWSLKKFVVMNEIDKIFVRRSTFQGKLCNINNK